MRHLVIVAGLLIAAPAGAVDLPTRKAGLWELTMDFHNTRLPHQTMRQCTDADSDRLMNLNFAGSNEQACSKKDIVPSGTGYVVDFGVHVRRHDDDLARGGDRLVRQRLCGRGDLDAPGRAGDAGRRGGHGESHMTSTAKWLGPCAAGEKPGDVIMSNGMKMNVLDLQKARTALPKR